MSISLYGLETGDFDTKWVISSGAATTPIVAAADNLRDFVCLAVVNATAGSLTWGAERYDGVTSYKFADAETLAARSRATFELPFRFAAADSIRVTSSGAGLHFFVTYRKLPSRT